MTGEARGAVAAKPAGGDAGKNPFQGVLDKENKHDGGKGCCCCRLYAVVQSRWQDTLALSDSFHDDSTTLFPVFILWFGGAM